jgi:hypothetical protein
MAWTARHLILPAALTVTTFAVVGVVAACGGDDDTNQKKEASTKCADLPGGSCELCLDDNGKTTCGPTQDCYIDSDHNCQPGGSS